MIEHTPGELSVTAHQDGFFVVPHHKPSVKDVVGNCHLITMACEVPHECDDPHCPGNVNRRKLEEFDGLLAACDSLAKAVVALHAKATVDKTDLNDEYCWLFRSERIALAAIATAKATTPDAPGNRKGNDNVSTRRT